MNESLQPGLTDNPLASGNPGSLGVEWLDPNNLGSKDLSDNTTLPVEGDLPSATLEPTDLSIDALSLITPTSLFPDAPSETQGGEDPLLGNVGFLTIDPGNLDPLLPQDSLFSVAAATPSYMAQPPSMPPGIIAEKGWISNGASVINGDIYTNREITNNGNTQFLNDSDFWVGSDLSIRNLGTLNPTPAVRELRAYVPTYGSLIDRALDYFALDGVEPRSFRGQPLNNVADVQRWLPSGIAETWQWVEASHGINLPGGTVLENMVLVVKNGDLNFNGATATLKNVILIVENGRANLNNVLADHTSIFASRGIQMNQAARFSGKSTLATEKGDILFNGATTSIEEKDHLRVVANQGSIFFNANAATRGQFRATGDFIQNGQSELVGLIRVAGQVRLNGNLTFEAQWPQHLPVIAVLDTGISAFSSDLDYGNVVNAYDFVDQDLDSLLGLGEGSEHGTFLAGLLAAGIGNSLGIDGMNDELLLYNSRVTGSGQWAEALLTYVNWLQEQGERNGIALIGADLVQQNPDGTVTTRFDLTPREREAIKAALDAGVMLVVPMGNEGGIASVLGQTSNEHGNVLSVIATNNDVVAPYSNRGWGGVLSAEGGSLDNPVRSLVGDGIGTMIGTSVAAGYMAGYASLVWAENPGLNYRQVMDILKQTATDLGPEGWDEETGYGKVDLKAALKLARETEGQPIEASNILLPSSWVGEGQVTPSERPASSDEQADDVPSGANWIGTDPDRSVGGSLSVPVPIPFVGDIFADERDYFKFGLSQDSQVNISLITNSISGGAWLTAKLRDENLNWLDDYKPGDTLAAGEYYVQVRLETVGVGKTANYTLNINTPADGDSGNGDEPGDDSSGGSIDIDPFFRIIYALYATQLGSVISSASNLDGVKIQQFSNGAIIGRGFFSNYVIYGAIWDAYSQQGGLNGALGLPTSNPQTQNGVTWQTFENGTLFDIGGIALQLDSRIVDEYFALGGPSGFLGIPTGAATVDSSGFIRQPFKNGYIVWNGVEAVAYKYILNPDTNTLIPVPDREENTQVSAEVSFNRYGESLGISNIVGATVGSLAGGVVGGLVGGAIGNLTSGIGLSVSGGLDKAWDLPFNLGQVEAKMNVYFDSFLSLGMFDTRFQSGFAINYDRAVLPGTLASLDIQSSLVPNPYFHTYLGAGFGFGLDTSIGFDLGFYNFSRSKSISSSLKFSEENFLAILEEWGFGVDLDLVATGTNFDVEDKNNNGLKGEIDAKDNAYQFLNQNILKGLAKTMIAAPEPVTTAAGFALEGALNTLDELGMAVKLGLNINQVSTLNIKGFEIDWDNVINGNEVFVSSEGSSRLDVLIPSNLNLGDKYSLDLTVKPKLEVSTVFKLQPQIEFEWNVGDFILGELGSDTSSLGWYATPLKELKYKESYNFTAWDYKSAPYSIAFENFAPLNKVNFTVG